MPDPISIAVIVGLIAHSVPSWLDTLRDTLLGRGKELAAEKGTHFVQDKLHLDEKEQQKHLEATLKLAVERGLGRFHTQEERDHYRSVLNILFEPGAHSEALRREALRLFTLSDIPNVAELNEAYNRSLRIRNLKQPTPPAKVDAATYLNSFFEALVIELYANPFFKSQMSDVIRTRAAMATLNMQRSLTEVVSTLCEIRERLVDDYTSEQFARDVQVYVEYVKKAFHYLKIVGVVPKDRNRDPELDGIFVPLSIKLEDQTIPEGDKLRSIVDVLEQYPCTVLLGGPGSGKSTITRYLAWSHAVANQSDAPMWYMPLLSGCPLPLRIELRRLIEERKQHNYNFLSYATEVTLRREGIEINPQMFKELLERRTMLVLFDGLDEVATLDDRRRLVEEIEHFALNYPGNRILVTSRPVGYALAPLSKQWFVHAQVQDFTNEQIREFLERWYTYVLQLSPIPHDDQQELEALYETLQGNQRLHKLAVNPLLLTVITALHRYERLPDRRVLIYDRCADLLLETWAKLRGTDARWKDMKMVKEDQSACVAHLGFVLHARSQEKENGAKGIETASIVEKENSATDVSMRFMQREVERFLKSQNLITEVAEQRSEAKRFLDLVKIEAGLIVERGKDENGEDLYGFVHRTFQEYFAAVDIYERYRQEEDPTIISEFLKEHLHDPHWREVILLLLGKLRGKPASKQLRQILEGKLVSRRSKYTNIVEQDLFFVGNCLTEEIAADNDLTETVVARLTNLVKQSPFLTQCTNALNALDELMQSRQCADRVRSQLTELLVADELDIELKAEIAEILYRNSSTESSGKQQAFQTLLQLAQRSDLSDSDMALITGALSRCQASSESDRKSQTVPMILRLMHLPTLSLEQQIQVAQALRRCSNYASSERRQAFRMLLHLAQDPDLPIKRQVQIARILSSAGSRECWAGERSQIYQMLTRLLQRSDLPFEQQIEVIESLDRSKVAAPGKQKQVFPKLLQLLQRPDLSIKQQWLVVSALHRCSSSPTERQQCYQMHLSIVQQSSLPIVQQVWATQMLVRYSLTDSEKRQAIEMLLQLAQRSDLPVWQQAQIVNFIYQSEATSLEEKQESMQMLLHLAQCAELTVEEQVRIARILYNCSPSSSKEEQQAVQMLLHLVQRPELTAGEQVEVAEALNWCSLLGSEEEKQAAKILSQLAQRLDLSVEEQIQVAEALHRLPFSSSKRVQATQVLFQWVQRFNLSIEQQAYIMSYFYVWLVRLIPHSKESRQIDRLLLQLVQRSDLSLQQQVDFLRVIYSQETGHSYSKEGQQIVQLLLDLMQHTELSFELQWQVCEALYWASGPGSEKREQALQMLLQLAQRTELSIEQLILVAHTIQRVKSSLLEEQQIIHRLLYFTQRPDVSFEQQILASRGLIQLRLLLSKEQRQQVVQKLWEHAKSRDLDVSQRLHVIAVFLEEYVDYSDKMQALRMVLALLEEEAANRYFEEHWQGAYSGEPDISDIPLILELIDNRATKPKNVCDAMYEMLDQLVPQFGRISLSNT